MYWGLFVRYMSDVVNNSHGDILVILCTHSYMVELYILKGPRL